MAAVNPLIVEKTPPVQTSDTVLLQKQFFLPKNLLLLVSQEAEAFSYDSTLTH